MALVTQTPTNPQISAALTDYVAGLGGGAMVTAFNARQDDLEARDQRIQAFLEELTQALGYGALWGGTISAGIGLSVNIAALKAFVGNVVEFDDTEIVGGLTANTTNHIFLRQDGWWTVNTTGSAPGDSTHGAYLKWGEAVTDGSGVVSVDNTRTDFFEALQSAAHLGTLAGQDAGAVAITGGSIAGIDPLAVADGGTGADNAADARDNLGLGGIALLDEVAATDLSDALQNAIAAAPAVTAGAELANVIKVSIQLKDAGGVNLAERRLLRALVSDSATGGECTTAPDGNVVVITGTLIQTVTMNKHFIVETDATGLAELNLTESTAKTFYVRAWLDSRSASVAVAFT